MDVEEVFGGRGGDISDRVINAIAKVVATSVTRINDCGGGGGDTSDVSATDGDDDISVDKSVNALLADELTGNGGGAY